MLKIEEFLKGSSPLYDVRSPGEFTQGTIPASYNLPLFTDEERKEVGTIYKQICPQKAFLFGLKIAGPKLALFAETALKNNKGGSCRIFCFRGGQRSGSMAWLFRSLGLEAATLQGGYKTFRRFTASIFSKKYRFVILGGLTGSGKTDRLHQLRREGAQIIDLEALAGSSGSAFGLLGKEKQPSTEAFENRLAFQLFSLDPDLPIWIEDESRMIGTCKIPNLLYDQMQSAPFEFLESSKEERIFRLLTNYGQFPKAALKEAAFKLHKKLGGARTKEVIAAIEADDLYLAVSLLLNYYDHAYIYSLNKRGK